MNPTREQFSLSRAVVKSKSRPVVWWGAALRRIRDLRYGAGWGAFHCDAIYRQLMLALLSAFHFTTFVETGTSRGYSTELVALHQPQLPIQTIEVVPATYELAKRSLARYPNISQHFGNSGDWIRDMIREHRFGNFPLFFLDAHWQRYWPLRDELRHLAEDRLRTVIVIDDFEVPGHPEFGFDIDGGAEVQEGEKCNLDYVRPALGPPNSYHAIFPKYSRPDAKLTSRRGAFRGHVVLFQNTPDDYEAFSRRPFVQKYYSPVGRVLPVVET